MLTTTIALSVLLASPAALDSAATDATVAAPASTGDVQEAQAKVEKEGLFSNIMERRYAFSMNDDLHASVADSVIGFFLGGLLCTVAGPVWLGGLIAGDPPQGYWEEAFVTWLFYAVPVVLLYGAFGWIPWIGWAFSVIMCPVSLALAFYMVPVNVINAWDRSAKRNGFKKKASSRRKDALPKREELALGPPSMAY